MTKIYEYNGITDEHNERTLSVAEAKKLEAEYLALETAKAEADAAKADAKSALLARLGITAEEAKLLLG